MVRVQNSAGQLAQAGFTDRRGEIRLRVDPGPYAVSATRAGYTPAAADLTVAPSGEAVAALRMAARPFVLDTVTVVGSTGREVGKQTFERRQATGNGIYLDSAYVAQRRATYPGDLLYSIPGIDVEVVRRTGYRRPSTRLGNRCLQFLVNGLPYYGGWPRWPRWVPLEETLRRTDVVAVEVYRELSEVPRELQRHAWRRDQCGLVVYWTGRRLDLRLPRRRPGRVGDGVMGSASPAGLEWAGKPAARQKPRLRSFLAKRGFNSFIRHPVRARPREQGEALIGGASAAPGQGLWHLRAAGSPARAHPADLPLVTPSPGTPSLHPPRPSAHRLHPPHPSRRKRPSAWETRICKLR